MWASGRALTLLAFAATALAGGDAVRAEERPAGWKEENAAFAYSLLGTALPIAAGSYIDSRSSSTDALAVAGPMAVGYVFGPSLGHFYAGRSNRALAGTAIRAGSVGVAWAAIEIHEGRGSSASGVVTVAVIASLVGISTMMADILEAPGSARKHNQALGVGGLHLSPAMIAGKAPGLRATVAF